MSKSRFSLGGISLAAAFAFAIALLAYSTASGKSPEEFVPPVPSEAKTPGPKGNAAVTPANEKGAPVKAASPKPSPAVSETAVFDTSKIHDAYLNGDFDQATRALEGQLKSKQPMSHAESVFVYKHLGVMFAASPATREKGKYYMYQLINIEPTAKILDMYASDMIHLIFRNVQEEYESKQGRMAKPVAASATAPAGPAATTGASNGTQPGTTSAAGATVGAKKSSPMLYWVAGGTAVAAGIVSIVLFTEESKPKKTIIKASE